MERSRLIFLLLFFAFLPLYTAMAQDTTTTLETPTTTQPPTTTLPPPTTTLPPATTTTIVTTTTVVSSPTTTVVQATTTTIGGTTSTQCGQGPISASGCNCGGTTYTGGACCNNVYYSSGVCPPQQTCSSSTPWYCSDQQSCNGAGAIWCTSGTGGYCQSSPCSTCSSTQVSSCNSESECRNAGGNWCNSYCTSSTCPTACGNGACEASETANSCPSDCGAACPTNYDPVCGNDGRTYSNECRAQAAGTSVKFHGQCTTCGNFICEQGEGSTSCPADCKQACVPLAYPADRCDGGWVGRYDDKGCVTGYDCQRIDCGNGRCEPGEYPSNCHDDCGQYCPKITDPVCTGGYLVGAGVDASGCSRGSTCCGDNTCMGTENDKNCPDDCGAGRPFCGDNHCDIGEDGSSCAPDCEQRGCPSTIHCPDSSERPCTKRDFGCFCEQCPISASAIPQGCRQETNRARGTVSVVCASGTSCPPLPRVEQMEAECNKNGGRFTLSKDPAGCQYADCQFVEQSGVGPFSKYSTCHTQDEIETIENKCTRLNLPTQVDVKGECKVATCGRPSEQLCERQTESERRTIEEECREQKLHPVKVFDETGCPRIECKEAFECSKELPDEAYKKCQRFGGEMVVKKNENGCVRFADCLRPGDDRDARVDPIERVPEGPELLEMAFKLEELRIKLDRLANQASDVAAYYTSVNSPDAERWKRVAGMFRSAVQEIDKIKTDLRDKLNDATVDDLLEVRHSVRYISDVLLKDITYVMLSTSEEVENIDQETDCSNDDRCFDRAFRRCQPTTFYPEGTRGPKVELRGLENDACVLYASMPAESAPPGFGAVDMTCKITNYAKGIRTPEEDVFPYCEGSMVELVKQYGSGPGPEGGGPGSGPPPGLIMAFLDNDKGPGGCEKRACIDYCDKNFNECMKYIDDWLAKNGGPGGAKSLFEMGQICEDRSKGDVCFKWILDRGVDPRDLGPGPDQGRSSQSREFERQEFRQPEFEREFGGEFEEFEEFSPSEFGGGEFRQPPGGKCPDGICDEFERANPNACPQDCGSQGGFERGGTATACPPESYDCNRVAEDGCESRFPCR